MGEKMEYGDIRNIMWAGWFFCLDDAVLRYSTGEFCARVGHREIAERIHEIISEALFMQSGDTVSYEQIEKDLFRMLPDEAEPVMFFALREMKKAFDAEGMGITPALIREWREYKAEGLTHPRQDIAPFMIIQETEAAVSRFMAIQRQRSKAAPAMQAEEPAADGAADGPEPLPDVLTAVKLHRKGSRWPESIAGAKGEIQERLFIMAGSTDRAISLFCELYQCPEWATALDSAIKRGPKKKKSSG